MKQQSRVWQLMARKLSHEISAEELEELFTILQQEPDMNYLMHVLTEIWKPGETPDKEEMDFAIGKLSEQIKQRQLNKVTWKKKNRRVNLLQYAFNKN